MTDHAIPRRDFLKVAGAAGTAAAATLTPGLASPAAAAEAKAPHPAAHHRPAPARQAAAPPLVLTATEAAFLTAAVDTLIPADELTPSGSECGLVTYIDRQLASDWGGGAKMYRSGPFHPGKPEQGYQLALTPREYFAAGIAAANAWTRKTYGRDFDRLAPAERVAALTAMEEGKAEFADVNAKAFFGRLHEMTVEGFFADPMYGGNRDKVGWKLIGFPGLPATYANAIDDYRGKRYTAPPQSIADFS